MSRSGNRNKTMPCRTGNNGTAALALRGDGPQSREQRAKTIAVPCFFEAAGEHRPKLAAGALIDPAERFIRRRDDVYRITIQLADHPHRDMPDQNFTLGEIVTEAQADSGKPSPSRKVRQSASLWQNSYR